MWTVQPSVIPQDNNVERKSNIFPFIVAYTSRPSVDRTSSRHPLTTDVDKPTFPLTKNWTGWTLCCASQGPEWTELLVPCNASGALATSTVSTTASLTSLQLMKNWCLSFQIVRCTSASKGNTSVPNEETSSTGAMAPLPSNIASIKGTQTVSSESVAAPAPARASGSR